MKKHCNIVFLIVTLLFLAFTVKYGSAFPYMPMRPENEGLYNINDNVVILNNNNFKWNIYNSNSSWLVEFYSSWCGHCQKFAPIWKTFSRNIRSWRSIVHVAAVDCANDDNSPICREYEVTSYPTLKFFPAYSQPGYLGLQIEKQNDVASMQKVLLNRLEIEQQEHRGSLWPNIVPYRMNNLQNVWQAFKGNVQYVFLIFEKPDSIVGTSVILHFRKASKLSIQRVLISDSASRSPSLMVLQRNGSQKYINIIDPTSEGIEKLIKDQMRAFGVPIKVTETMEDNPELGRTQFRELEITRPTIGQFGDIVFQLDLEKTLLYSINHEISMSKTISGEKLLALNNYLNILSSYFPIRGNGASYLSALNNAIKGKRQIGGETLRKISSEFANQLPSVSSGSVRWIGCQGSSRIYRGYPCGLWTMFHTLTVNFANQNSHYDPAQVLRAIYGYVTNFFGCAECSRHFADMAKRNEIFKVQSKDESILWLWRAHNEVNRRLAGDLTEDPEHKKIQYPAKNDCPSCRDINNNWIEKEVLLYLKKKYSYQAINLYGYGSTSMDHYSHLSAPRGQIGSWQSWNLSPQLQPYSMLYYPK